MAYRLDLPNQVARIGPYTTEVGIALQLVTWLLLPEPRHDGARSGGKSIDEGVHLLDVGVHASTAVVSQVDPRAVREFVFVRLLADRM